MEYVTVGASLLGGGAVGAIITQSVNWYRDRLQTVSFSVSRSVVFEASARLPQDAHYELQVKQDGKNFSYKNLHAIDVELINRGNRDIASFDFGATIGEGFTPVLVTISGNDRHHVGRIATPEAPAMPRALDFELTPFNRRDRYKVTFHVTKDDDPEVFPDYGVELSSRQPVVFRPLITNDMIVSAQGIVGRALVKGILGALVR